MFNGIFFNMTQNLRGNISESLLKVTIVVTRFYLNILNGKRLCFNFSVPQISSVQQENGDFHEFNI
jgi:hypothetical protein